MFSFARQKFSWILFLCLACHTPPNNRGEERTGPQYWNLQQVVHTCRALHHGWQQGTSPINCQVKVPEKLRLIFQHEKDYIQYQRPIAFLVQSWCLASWDLASNPARYEAVFLSPNHSPILHSWPCRLPAK